MSDKNEKKMSIWRRALEAAAGDEPVSSLPRRVLKRLPGGDVAQQQLDKLEGRVLRELKARLDKIEAPSQTTNVSVLAVSVQQPAPGSEHHAAGTLMRDLLARSTEQTRDDAQRSYYTMVLKSLLPDEARILSAVSDGSVYPLLAVHSASKIGIGSTPVLENICSVGKAAGVMWPEMTRGYVHRLMAHGLVETAPEDYNLQTKYEMLETEEVVRKALDQIKKNGQRAQIKRRVLKISELGASLWQACRISED
jgi:hypothetical protein